MEFLAFLYTVLLVAICLMMALLLYRSAKPADGELRVTRDDALQLSQCSAMRYDREGDDHYDLLSALQKSIRGSDPDAACHYLARLLEAGQMPSA